jgi:hypothetical protein
MAKPGSVIGWKLDAEERSDLLKRFPPRYPKTVADHVTLETNAARKPLPPHVEARIVGLSDDKWGVEAMVVTIDGTSGRPDGSTYHITWSLAPGRRAKESNDVLRDHGWSKFQEPIPVTVSPARF